MLSYSEIVARKVGRLDALLFFAFWSCILLASTARSIGALPVIIFLLVPASALVGWRGAISVKMFLDRSASVRRAAIEGFVWGAVAASAVWAWGAYNAAHAAGSVLDGLSPLQLEFWVSVATSLIPAIAIFGCLGAVHGIVFFYVTRKVNSHNGHPTDFQHH